MEYIDDRTEEQKKTHYFAVVARDKFMSGWGPCKNGHSRCGWVCASIEDAERMFKWVSNRSEMRNVNIVDMRKYRAPRGTAHFHLYVADKNHVGLR